MTETRPWARDLAHPAIVCGGPQLLSVIAGMEAGTYPLPDDAIWRDDLPRDLAVRLAKATGATDEQIAAGPEPAEAAPEPTAEEESEPGPQPDPDKPVITIRHNHEDGTLVYGTEKGDGIYELIGPRSLAHFRFFPSIKMIGIAQSRDRLAKRSQIGAAADTLRAAGWPVIVEIDDTPRSADEVKESRAGRLDHRYERLTGKAQREAAEAESRRRRADEIGERFAGGQPILAGHHSERSARADKKRMDQADRAAAQHQRKAEWAARAAAVVGEADAYRERPAVIRRRIDKLEGELRQTMHRINGTRPANDWRGAYYSEDPKPASGEWLAECQARKTFLEHQLEADRAALAAHEAAGYVLLDRTKVHKGDRVHWGASWGDGVHGALVTRTNPKTVTLDRRSYPRTLGYEKIQRVECPHDDETVTVTGAGLPRPPRRARPEVPAAPPVPREEPVVVDARTEYFPTPPAVVERVIEAARIGPGMTVLEPSAGLGALAHAADQAGAEAVDCVELSTTLAGKLRRAGVACTVKVADFMSLPVPAGGWYDRVVMNPPFSRVNGSGWQDVAHVTRAASWLLPGGLLVAVMSAGVEFHSDKQTVAFRALVADRGGTIERLPDDAFKPSNTSTRTCLVTLPGTSWEE